MLLIQDVHQVFAAQLNIAELLRLAAHEKNPSQSDPLFVGIEGAAGEFALGPHRMDRDEDGKIVSRHFLESGLIGGPEYFGLTAEDEPLLWGVEKPALYRKHVGAYRQQMSGNAILEKEIRALRSSLDELRRRRLPQGFLELDDLLFRRDAGEASTKELIIALNRRGLIGKEYVQLRRFLRTELMERSLDFDKAERERNEILSSLRKTLTPPEIQKFYEMIDSCRSGRIDYGAFHAWFVLLLKKNGIRLESYPEFNRYSAYSQEAAGIDPYILYDELEHLCAFTALGGRIDEAQGLVMRASADFRLLLKLVHNNLTWKEWELYLSRRGEIRRLPERFKEMGGQAPSFASDLGPFERFYAVADERSAAMVGLLLEKAKSVRARKVVLVAGGFHTPRLESLLTERGVSFVTWSPRVGPVTWGNGYLETLRASRTPLDKLLAGEKLFLALPRPLQRFPLLGDEPAQAGRLLALRQALLSAFSGVRRGEPYSVRKIPGSRTRIFASPSSEGDDLIRRVAQQGIKPALYSGGGFSWIYAEERNSVRLFFMARGEDLLLALPTILLLVHANLLTVVFPAIVAVTSYLAFIRHRYVIAGAGGGQMIVRRSTELERVGIFFGLAALAFLSLGFYGIAHVLIPSNGLFLFLLWSYTMTAAVHDGFNLLLRRLGLVLLTGAGAEVSKDSTDPGARNALYVNASVERGRLKEGVGERFVRAYPSGRLPTSIFTDFPDCVVCNVQAYADGSLTWAGQRLWGTRKRLENAMGITLVIRSGRIEEAYDELGGKIDLIDKDSENDPESRNALYIDAEVENGRLKTGVGERFVRAYSLSGVPPSIFTDYPDCVVCNVQADADGTLSWAGQPPLFKYRKNLKNAKGITIVIRGGKVVGVYDGQGKKIDFIVRGQENDPGSRNALYIDAVVEKGRLKTGVGERFVRAYPNGFPGVALEEYPDCVVCNMQADSLGTLQLASGYVWKARRNLRDATGITLVIRSGAVAEAYDGKGAKIDLDTEKDPKSRNAVYLNAVVENGKLQRGAGEKFIGAFPLRFHSTIWTQYPDCVITNVVLNRNGGLKLGEKRPWRYMNGYGNAKGVTLVVRGGEITEAFDSDGQPLFPVTHRGGFSGTPIDEEEVARLIELLGERGAYRILRRYYGFSEENIRRIMDKIADARQKTGAGAPEGPGGWNDGTNDLQDFFDQTRGLRLPSSMETNPDAEEALAWSIIRALYAYLIRDHRFLESVKEESENALNSEFLRRVYRRVWEYYQAVSDLKIRRINEEKRSLKFYQREAVHFILQKKRVILGDDQGLGKTLEVIAAALNAREGADGTREPARKVLVVCSRPAMRVWEREIKESTVGGHKSFLFRRINILDSARKMNEFEDARFVIISYDILRFGGPALQARLKQAGFDFVAVDEAHKMRNETLVSEAMRNLMPDETFRPDYQVLMTGSPLVGRRVVKIFNLLHWLYPEDYPSRDLFMNGFQRRDDQIWLLSLLLEKIMLRRLKEDVFIDFPKKEEIVHFVTLEGQQRDLYSELMRRFKDSFNIGILVGLMQAVVSPGLYDYDVVLENGGTRFSFYRGQGRFEWKGRSYTVETIRQNVGGSVSKRGRVDIVVTGLDGTRVRTNHFSWEGGVLKGALTIGEDSFRVSTVSRIPDSAKLEELDRIVEDARGRGKSLVVFTDSREHAQFLRYRYRRYPVEALIGGMSDLSQKKTIDRFQANGGVMIATYGVGSESITLHRASEVVLFDPPWNNQEKNQAIDRLYRLGQTQDVTVHLLVARGTFDEHVLRLILISGLLARAILGESWDEDVSERTVLQSLKEALQKTGQAMERYRARLKRLFSEEMPLVLAAASPDGGELRMDQVGGERKLSFMVRLASGETRTLSSFIEVVALMPPVPKGAPVLSEASQELVRTFVRESIQREFREDVPVKQTVFWMLLEELVPSFRQIDFHWGLETQVVVCMAILTLLFEDENISEEAVVERLGDALAVDDALRFMDYQNVFRVLCRLGVLKKEFYYDGRLLTSPKPLMFSVSGGAIRYVDWDAVRQMVPEALRDPPFDLLTASGRKSPEYPRLSWPDQKRLAREAARGNDGARNALLYDCWLPLIMKSRVFYKTILRTFPRAPFLFLPKDLYQVALNEILEALPSAYAEIEERPIWDVLRPRVGSALAWFANRSIKALGTVSLNVPTTIKGEETDESIGDRLLAADDPGYDEVTDRLSDDGNQAALLEQIRADLIDAGLNDWEVEAFFLFVDDIPNETIAQDLTAKYRTDISEESIAAAIAKAQAVLREKESLRDRWLTYYASRSSDEEEADETLDSRLGAFLYERTFLQRQWHWLPLFLLLLPAVMIHEAGHFLAARRARFPLAFTGASFWRGRIHAREQGPVAVRHGGAKMNAVALLGFTLAAVLVWTFVDPHWSVFTFLLVLCSGGNAVLLADAFLPGGEFNPRLAGHPVPEIAGGPIPPLSHLLDEYFGPEALSRDRRLVDQARASAPSLAEALDRLLLNTFADVSPGRPVQGEDFRRRMMDACVFLAAAWRSVPTEPSAQNLNDSAEARLKEIGEFLQRAEVDTDKLVTLLKEGSISSAPLPADGTILIVRLSEEILSDKRLLTSVRAALAAFRPDQNQAILLVTEESFQRTEGEALASLAAVVQSINDPRVALLEGRALSQVGAADLDGQGRFVSIHLEPLLTHFIGKNTAARVRINDSRPYVWDMRGFSQPVEFIIDLLNGTALYVPENKSGLLQQYLAFLRSA